MPFKSERQRRWMWANNPEMAEECEEEEKNESRRMKITNKQLKRIIREIYGNPIGSGDPSQEIFDWAEDGNRVTIAGKNVWAGLGNRSGLHSYADELTQEKWAKSGDRFMKKIEKLPAGTEVELKRYKNKNRDRGNWVTAGTVTTIGPVQSTGPSAETPSSKRMRGIVRDLSMAYDRDIRANEITVSLYQGSDAPFHGKNWEVTIGKSRMLFKDQQSDEYAEWDGDGWEFYTLY